MLHSSDDLCLMHALLAGEQRPRLQQHQTHKSQRRQAQQQQPLRPRRRQRRRHQSHNCAHSFAMRDVITHRYRIGRYLSLFSYNCARVTAEWHRRVEGCLQVGSNALLRERCCVRLNGEPVEHKRDDHNHSEAHHSNDHRNCNASCTNCKPTLRQCCQV